MAGSGGRDGRWLDAGGRVEVVVLGAAVDGGARGDGRRYGVAWRDTRPVVVVGGSGVVCSKTPVGHFSGKFLNKKLRKVGGWVWWTGWSLDGCWRAGGGSGWCWRR